MLATIAATFLVAASMIYVFYACYFLLNYADTIMWQTDIEIEVKSLLFSFELCLRESLSADLLSAMLILLFSFELCVVIPKKLQKRGAEQLAIFF